MKRLLERKPERPVFPRARLNERLSLRDRAAGNGEEKSWVHATQLAWQRHYRARP